MNGISVRNWRAGVPLIAGLLFAIAPYGASGQAGLAESPSNVECLERLEMPEYPPLARQARIEGTQTVKVVLSGEGTVRTVESSFQAKIAEVEKAFKKSAERAINASQLSKTCGGKTITLIFHYELHVGGDKPLFAFGPPNQFWVRAVPFYAMPETAAK